METGKIQGRSSTLLLEVSQHGEGIRRPAGEPLSKVESEPIVMTGAGKESCTQKDPDTEDAIAVSQLESLEVKARP
jgi:hypothetical protein